MQTPPTDLPLQISDLQAGTDYLAQIPLANPPVAEHRLLRFIDSLLVSPPDSGILLALLELTRAPLGFVEDEMARRYSNKPLPLGVEAESSFRQVILAWSKMVQAYARCIDREAAAGGEPRQPASVTATILHRCIFYRGMIIQEHYRARRELPAGIWLDLHRDYQNAEHLGIACTPVEDALDSCLQATHCSAAYITTQLLHLAGPYNHSLRNLMLIRHWAAMWAPLVSIHRLEDEFELPAFSVELGKDAPLNPSSATCEPGDDMRRFDTTRLGLQISHMLSQLRQRMSPAQLGLGEESPAHVVSLLDYLARPWNQLAAQRRFRRFASQGTAHLATGFEAMHFHLTGLAFQQPVTSTTYSRQQFDALFAFRDRVEPGQNRAIDSVGSHPLEAWSVINHSANGFRLARSGAGQGLVHGQLIALRPHDGDQFLLGQISWLMQETSDGLIAGLATLPGVPRGVGVRHTAPEGGEAPPYVPAFLLSAIAAVGAEASLVVPPGTYQTGRDLDVITSASAVFRLRMNQLLQRGADFERVSYLQV